MPTNTVYVLVAACNRPDAVEKAYKIKVHAQDRPMSMWISSTKQLEPAKHLINPVLWDFMEAAWPSSISMVIPRGPWLDCLVWENQQSTLAHRRVLPSEIQTALWPHTSWTWWGPLPQCQPTPLEKRTQHIITKCMPS
uniref:Threonylcarbamoyl-AMP synthase n=1 Tax=Anguilla anguilla TaxID=7936 RepID=A0A0E9X587_ANGAN